MNNTVVASITPFAVAAALGLIALPVQADELKPHVKLDMGFNTRSPEGQSITTWAPNLHVFAKVDEDVGLSADWGLAAVDANSDGSGLVPLNPFIGIHITPKVGKLSLRLGVGTALPVAEGDDQASLDAYQSARAVRGSWDPWLYATETFTVALPLRAEFDVADPLLLAAEGAAFIHFGTSADSGQQLGLQGALAAVGRLGPVDLGLRVQAVQVEDRDLQTALEPFAQLRLGPVGIQGRLTMNLDAPDGFAFDREGVWGAHLGLAYYY